MSTNTTGGQGQEPGSASGTGPGAQQQDQQGGTAGTPGQEPAGTPAAFDPATIADPATRSYVEAMVKDARDARGEAGRYRTDRNTLQQQVQQFQQASETAEQTAQREAAAQATETDRLRAENRDLKVGGTVALAATKAQAFNPATVYGLIKDQVQVNDAGVATNVDTLITALKASDPYLFKRNSADAGAGQGPGGTVGKTMNDQIRNLAGRGTIQG